MRPCSVALKAYLETSLQFETVDLYTFQWSDGETFRYCEWSNDLTLPSAAFPAGSLNAGSAQTFVSGPKFGKTKTSIKIGVAPTELDIEVQSGPNDLIGTFTFANAFRMGLFDGATIELDRFFIPAGKDGHFNQSRTVPIPLDTSLGCIIWFYGRVAETDVGRSSIKVKVKSLLDLLSIHQMPRRLYQSACGHVFGDTMCGYDRVAGKNALGVATGVGQLGITADGGSSQYLIVATVAPSTQYIQGTIISSSGPNNGAKRTVATISGANVVAFKPFLFPVSPGDTFNLLPGCDHTVATCNNIFNNLLRFGGFPYIPPPEMAF